LGFGIGDLCVQVDDFKHVVISQSCFLLREEKRSNGPNTSESQRTAIIPTALAIKIGLANS
ncbi:hypothetical protein, partial [Agrobacterium cavarae]|uniref:hypothetical protein n=1 Tax=Agrobacterium cavarae TaxID=2528239 RepID=UPI002FD8EDFA